MAQKVITENYINQVIKHIIKEGLSEGGMLEGMFETGQGQGGVIDRFEDLAMQRNVQFENLISRLTEQAEICMYLGDVLRDLDKTIKEKLPNVQEAIKKNYDGWFYYKLQQPIPFDEEDGSYGEYEYLSDDLHESIPREYQKYIDIYTDDDGHNIKGLTIIVELPDVPDWDE